MHISPVHVAFRGFHFNLPDGRILDCIHQGLSAGRVKRPAFTRWPGNEPISVQIGESHLVNWRRQFEDGVSVDIPDETARALDDILGVPDIAPRSPAPPGET